VAQEPAVFELGGVEGVLVPEGGRPQAVMVRESGLDHGLPVSRTGESEHPADGLKSPFGGGEIGKGQPGFGIEQTDELGPADARPAGQELGSEKDVDFSGLEALQNPLPIRGAAGQVAVEPGQAGPREKSAELLFDRLEADTSRLQDAAAAIRT